MHLTVIPVVLLLVRQTATQRTEDYNWGHGYTDFWDDIQNNADIDTDWIEDQNDDGSYGVSTGIYQRNHNLNNYVTQNSEYFYRDQFPEYALGTFRDTNRYYAMEPIKDEYLRNLYGSTVRSGHNHLYNTEKQNLKKHAYKNRMFHRSYGRNCFRNSYYHKFNERNCKGVARGLLHGTNVRLPVIIDTHHFNENRRSQRGKEYGRLNFGFFGDLVDSVKSTTSSVAKGVADQVVGLGNVGKDAVISSVGAATTSLSNMQKQATGIIKSTVDNVYKGVLTAKEWSENALKEMAGMGIVVGKTIIQPPLLKAEKVVNVASFVTSLGVDLTEKLAQGAGDMTSDGWKAIEAVQIPGWNVIMLFPNGLISVVNKTSDTVWFLTSVAGKAIVAAKVHALYTAIEVVSSTLGAVLRTFSLDCVNLKAHTYPIDHTLVDKFQTSVGRVCGITNIHSVHNVTITRDDDSFLVVVVPYTIENLSVSFSAANVSGVTGSILKNVPMVVTIARLNILGTISFTAGTIIKFITINIQVTGMADFQIKLDKSERTGLMDVVESIGDVISPMVKDTINKKLLSFEKRISDAICNC